MATVTITLEDKGPGFSVEARFDPAPSQEAVEAHSHELTQAQHVAVHLMEFLEQSKAAEREREREPDTGPTVKSGTVLVQADDPRYKL